MHLHAVGGGADAADVVLEALFGGGILLRPHGGGVLAQQAEEPLDRHQRRLEIVGNGVVDLELGEQPGPFLSLSALAASDGALALHLALLQTDEGPGQPQPGQQIAAVGPPGAPPWRRYHDPDRGPGLIPHSVVVRP